MYSLLYARCKRVDTVHYTLPLPQHYTHTTLRLASLYLYTLVFSCCSSRSRFLLDRSVLPASHSPSLLSLSLSLRFLSASACCCRPRRTITIITRHYHYTLLHCGYTSLYLLLNIPSSSPSRWFECIFTFTILYCVSIVSRP
jgi:hypothetical protein